MSTSTATPKSCRWRAPYAAPSVLVAVAAMLVGCLGNEVVPDPRRCIPPTGMGSPQTIEEVVSLVNALPEPVTISCFVESLDRPLEVNAAKSQFSAQPAVGVRSPRLFIFQGELVMSVVPDGVGATLLELGQPVTDRHSIKAELELPDDIPATPASPFDRIRRPDFDTSCGVCHAEEAPEPSITYAEAFRSVALRPRDEDDVDLERVRHEWTECDPTMEPERCEMLDALFSHGPVVPRPFSPDLPTFF